MVELTFLGTGTSTGVPVIGCSCPVCTSEDPRDRRGRTSAVVRFDGHTILIDTSPELRTQAVMVGLSCVDAVVFTHAHADHVAGIDDLRRFNELRQAHLPVYADAKTSELLRERYAYAFQDMFPFYGGKPDLILNVFDGPFTLFEREIVPIAVTHGRWVVHGFRFGPLVYVTDAKGISPESIDLIRGADVLVLNALRATPHPTHLSIGEALDVIAEVRPREAYIVHVSHEVSHAAVNDALPAHVRLAYDGLTVRTQRDW
jgi:phosphoribosyl 1,2-cyclic phosphate phosphodiesterase